MKTLGYGAAAAITGLIGLIFWFPHFLDIIKGIVPIMLILGGGVAIYLGYDELKTTLQKETQSFEYSVDTEEKVKGCEAEIAKLKEEIASLKGSKTEGE